MREISPAVNASADEFLNLLAPEARRIVVEIRRQKHASERSTPSPTLADRSALLTKAHRERLLDAVAALVDENLGGRSEMCYQFADLLHRALTYLKYPSKAVVGWAMYFSPDGQEIFRWRHAWVRIGEEVIDGNVDSLSENPKVPKTVRVAPYWGPISLMPPDRRLREERGATLPADGDVSDIWWPELRDWIDSELLRSAAPDVANDPLQS